MQRLNEVSEGKMGSVLAVSGTDEFERRITAVGITPGSSFRVVQNEKKYPVLIQIRNTLLAVDRKESEGIEVEVV